MKTGFAADTTSAAQSKRGTANKGKTPWRNGPSCIGRKARASHQLYLQNAPAKPRIRDGK